MKNISQMMKQAQEMQKRMEDMQQSLERAEIIGESGGGLVKITLNGKGLMLKISIEESLYKENEVSIIEDLIIAGYNDAKNKLEEYSNEEMKKITGGVNIPSGLKSFF
ncbi:MAG: YbaB/EbfC family nucleoid-associated protein [Rhodospirillaceae bacterium]|nr:YbaB/EbfC family nucleoid-associated protein [Rhodospirillaceae bacterium]|tara:strand:- start:31 stop:354 length:324 start_codon:yes stop_codon:yes gene_type:complete